MKKNNVCEYGPRVRYSQHFIFLHHTKLERLAMEKHSSLSGPFSSYKEKSFVNMGPYSQRFIFFVTYKWVL